MATIKKTLDKLRTLYNQAQGAEDIKLFLRKLFDFIKEYDANTLLRPILQSIVDKANQDRKELFYLYPDALAEINFAQKEVEAYSKNHTIDISFHVRLFHFFDQRKTNRNEQLVDLESIMYKMMVFANELSDLSELDSIHHSFVLKFVREIPLYNKNCINLDLRLNSVVDYYKEKERQDLRDEDKIYYNWDLFAWIYNIGNDYEGSIKSLLDDSKKLASCRAKDVRTWLENPSGCEKAWSDKFNHAYNLRFLKDSLQKVFFYTEENIVLDIIKYDKKQRSLHLGRHIIPFLRDGFQQKVLPILTEETEEFLSWDLVYEETTSKDPGAISHKKREKYKKKLDDCCRHINEQISKYTNGIIRDFLISKKSDWKINPIYL